MFNPWESTFDEAKAAYEASEFGVDDPTGPLFQWAGAERVKQAKHSIENGDGFAVLMCIRICVTNGLVAPKWLAYAFNRRYDAVNLGRALSWDDPLAFGKPYKTGTQKNSVKKRRMLTFSAWNIATTILSEEPGTPIDAAFFERVGKTTTPPVGKTEAEKAYYRAKKYWDR